MRRADQSLLLAHSAVLSRLYICRMIRKSNFLMITQIWQPGRRTVPLFNIFLPVVNISIYQILFQVLDLERGQRPMDLDRLPRLTVHGPLRLYATVCDYFITFIAIFIFIVFLILFITVIFELKLVNFIFSLFTLSVRQDFHLNLVKRIYIDKSQLFGKVSLVVNIIFENPKVSSS